MKKSDFTDLFKFGYLFIDNQRVVEFDGDIKSLSNNIDVRDKVFERVNQFDYSFTILLVHFSSEHIEDGRVNIEEVQNIFPLDDNAKREIEISFDSRIRVNDSIWPEATGKLQEHFLYEDAKKGVQNIWKILRIEQPLYDLQSILSDKSIREIVWEVQNDKRPEGDLPFWVYLIRYERHGFFPKNSAGYFMDLINIYINTLQQEETPPEAIENTGIYKKVREFQDLHLIELINSLAKTNEGRNFFDKINQIAANEGNSVIIALIFLVLKNKYIDGFNLKEEKTLNYCKKYFPQEINFSLYLLGIFLGNGHTFECLYDSLPLPIFKSVENISTVPNIIDTTHSNNKSLNPQLNCLNVK